MSVALSPKFQDMSPTFKVLAERRLGTLNPEQRKTWSKLVSRRKKLHLLQEELEQDEDFFVDGVLADVVQENHGSVRGVRLTEEGLLLQTYCECYRCQARLQQLAPSYVVEQMVRLALIEEEDVSEARKWAAATEKKFGKPVLN